MARDNRLVQEIPGIVIPSIPFLVVLIGGLVTAVYAMLQGVTTAPSAPPLARVVRKSAPAIAGFGVAFGIIGYLLTTRSSLNPWTVLAIAGTGAALTLTMTAPGVVRLTRRAPSADPEMEGQLAEVVSALSASKPGEISYQRDGRSIRQPALNVGEGVFEPGKEVVIDRVENGIAYVEDWKTVEARL